MKAQGSWLPGGTRGAYGAGCRARRSARRQGNQAACGARRAPQAVRLAVLAVALVAVWAVLQPLGAQRAWADEVRPAVGLELRAQADGDGGDAIRSGAGSQATAADALHALQSQMYYRPGGACPQGANVGWLAFGFGATSCAANCYAFACGVSYQLFGTFPLDIMETGYTAKEPGNMVCVGALKNPTQEQVKALLLKASPGDFLQFCGGTGGWGFAQHSGIVEAVDAGGVRIYQHGDGAGAHITSTYYGWKAFFEDYLGADRENYRGYAGVGLYHAKNYEERYPAAAAQVEVADGVYILRAGVGGGMVLDVAASGGRNVQVWQATGAQNQLFRITRNADGTYQLANVKTGGVLEAAAAAQGANVSAGTARGAACQRWYAEDAGQGCVSLRNLGAGACLDVAGGQASNGANVQVYAGNGTAAQAFVLERWEGSLLGASGTAGAPDAAYTPDRSWCAGLAARAGFLDLDAGAWYMTSPGGSFPATQALYLDYTMGRGLMTGMGDGLTFAPEGNLTRAQAAMVLFRMANPGAENGADSNETGLPDVQDGAWYTRAVNWCYRESVVTGFQDAEGVATHFGPDDPVTREQLATMVARYCMERGGMAPAGADVQRFSDAAELGTWCHQGVAFCNANGIMTGMGGTGRFGAGEPATRAQMAKIVAVAAQLLD